MPVFNNHHVHFFHFGIDDSRELRLLYLVRIVRSLINNLVFFFLPLFIYQLSPEIHLPFLNGLDPFQKAMGLIALFYVLDRGAGILSVIPVGKTIAKIGHGRAFLISQLVTIVSLILFRVSVAMPMVLFLAAIVDGFERNWFWNGYQTLMAQNSQKKKMGQDLGFVQFLINFMMMVSPAIGGIVIKFFGYESLFLYASLLLLIGMMASLSMRSKSFKNTPSVAEFLAWIRERTFRRLAISFGGKYFHDAAIYIWPLYIFLLLGAVDKVGFLYTFSLFLAMVLSFFIGYQVDHEKTKKPFFISGAIMGGLWFLRMNITSIWSIAISDMVSRISQNYHGLFFDKKLFNRSRGDTTFSYFVYHELILDVSAVVFWALFGVLFVILGLDWVGLFVLGAVGVLLSMLIKEHK